MKNKEKVLSTLEEIKFVLYLKCATLMYQVFSAKFFQKIFAPKKVLFFPTRPAVDGYAINKFFDVLGYKITNNLKDPFDLAVHWEDKTEKTVCPEFNDIKQKCQFINSECHDISKSYVQDVFEEVFGYPLAVDPLIYRGVCVRKSNDNSQHDGELIQCPIEANEIKKGCVYQKLVRSEYDDNFAEEMRLPVFKDQIPFVYFKYRPLQDRFGTYRKLILAKEKVNELFSEEEIKKILLFCKKIHLEYGELDVLRDNEDKRIYIVDANDTPWGQPKYRSVSDHWKAIKMMAETFENVFIKC